MTTVWLTYYEPSAFGAHRGIYASEELAKRACEAEVEGWIANPPWSEEEDGEVPVLHPVVWSLEPDPALPEVFHDGVPKDKYVWIGRYCDDQPSWLFKMTRQEVVES